jgi:3-hydroxyacyl-CoA dehydrogenase
MKHISVIGGGTMGNGIAHTFAQKGYQVSLIDIKQEFVDKALQTIEANLDRQVKKGTIDEAMKDPLLVNMVQAGMRAIKSGEGFYKYLAGSKDLIVAERFR